MVWIQSNGQKSQMPYIHYTTRHLQIHGAVIYSCVYSGSLAEKSVKSAFTKCRKITYEKGYLITFKRRAFITIDP